MTRRKDRDHSRAFKAHEAIAALKGDRPLAEWAQQNEARAHYAPRWLDLGPQCPRCNANANLFHHLIDWRFACHRCGLEWRYRLLSRVALGAFFFGSLVGVFLFPIAFDGVFAGIGIGAFAVLMAFMPVEQNDKVNSPMWPRKDAGEMAESGPSSN